MLIIAVGLTTMGPIFHYTGYTVAIIFILFYKKNNIPQIMSDVWHHNKLNIILLFILILYLTISYYITATNLSSYLKNISIPLEMCIGVFLSIIILDTKEKIKTFTNAVAIMMVMTIIFLYIQFYFGYSIRSIYVMTTYYGLGWITCCLASYVLYYMFFNKAKKLILDILILSLLGVSLITAFSLGTWLAAFCQVCIAIFLAYRYNPENLQKKLIYSSILVLAIAALLNFFYKNIILDMFLAQFMQLAAVDNIHDFTSARNEIWNITCIIIRENPWFGTGYDTLFDMYPVYFAKYKEILGLVVETQFTPHNMYLGMAQESGIPSIILFVLFIISVTYKSLKDICLEENRFKIITIMYLSSLLILGLTGDHIFYDRRDFAVLCWTAIGLGMINIKAKYYKD